MMEQAYTDHTALSPEELLHSPWRVHNVEKAYQIADAMDWYHNKNARDYRNSSRLADEMAETVQYASDTFEMQRVATQTHKDFQELRRELTAPSRQTFISYGRAVVANVLADGDKLPPNLAAIAALQDFTPLNPELIEKGTYRGTEADIKMSPMGIPGGVVKIEITPGHYTLRDGDIVKEEWVLSATSDPAKQEYAVTTLSKADPDYETIKTIKVRRLRTEDAERLLTLLTSDRFDTVPDPDYA